MDYRNQSNYDKLPKIPAQVIGYEVANELFKLFEQNNNLVPDSWKGEMSAKYTFGGKLQGGRLLTLNVYNKRKIAKTYNVIGIIRGELEPGLI